MDKEAALIEQQAEIERKLQRIKEKRRKLETRKKVVVGATLMKENSEESLRGWLNERLTRKEDRALFGLPENKPNPNPPPAQNQSPNPNPGSNSDGMWDEMS